MRPVCPPRRSAPDLSEIRAAFPALDGDTIFLENAGGSQVPRIVADAIRDYMLERYVQLGAGYELSRRATETVDAAHRLAEVLVNAAGRGPAILGPSTTALCRMLAACYRPLLRAGDEIVVAENGHEANVGPWVEHAAEDGVVVRVWPVDPITMRCRLDDLTPLLGPRTRLVALPHVSNLLGEVADVAAITAMAHAAGARVVVDGVAYAPHRAIDVAAWDVDWYVWSTYKVYGPHMACLYGRSDAVAELRHPNHFFIPPDEVPYGFEPGGVSHEGCAGLLATGAYLRFLAGGGEGPVTRGHVGDAYARMAELERPLVKRLVEGLRSTDGVRIIGPDRDGHDRVGTVSFVHDGRSSREIAAAVNGRGIGIRHGHMYAYRLCRALGLDPEDGVVRVSLVHYNTMDEIERVLETIGEALAGSS